MKRWIVTTTINQPTKALHLFAEKKDWSLIVVGDLITPHKEFRKFEKKFQNVVYLSAEDQEKKYRKLSDAIGWRKIQRRNIGYVEAYKLGADVIATVDDDNIPYDDWGKNIRLGVKTEVNFYKEKNLVFDPVGATNTKQLWHRGFPIQLVSQREYSKPNRKTLKFDIQADFWDGDPDIDAVCRMIFAPDVKYQKKYFPMASNKISPFNSQNTFLSREVIPDYFLFPDVGRMDDIWAGYYAQAKGHKVVYSHATVRQDRNIHDLTKDMRNEYVGYENNIELINQITNNPDNILTFLPKSSQNAFRIYKSLLG